MKNNQAFTLIELLVVVLIIGILAAVALPQYQKAVDKSRFMKYIQMGYGIKRAQEAYYLANGKYATDLTALDVEYAADCSPNANKNMFLCSDGFYLDNSIAGSEAIGLLMIFLCPEGTDYASCMQNQVLHFSLGFDYATNEDYRSKSFCVPATARGQALCKSLQNV